jgi:hypothetical protein
MSKQLVPASRHIRNDSGSALQLPSFSRMIGKQETAPAKFEGDLAPNANHSGGKDLRKLPAASPFAGPTGNCSSTAAT